jgi:hypothetical protein
VPYSGYVQTQGTLRLPASSQFSELADLLGQRSTLRVWWRSDTDWRVDHIDPTGESDLIHDASGTTSWDFETNRATRTPPASIRLPQTSDLLPPTLTHTLLSRARAQQVTRLAAARIAGIAAPGFRFIPQDPRTSITRVDVWVDPRTGLPLRVAVFGADLARPSVTSTFASVSIAEPSARQTTFRPAPRAPMRFEGAIDIVAAANQYAPVDAPETLQGLSRTDTTGAVGVYGGGVDQMVAIPLQDRVAVALLEQLEDTPGSTLTGLGDALSVDPVNILLSLTGPAAHAWLLVGTVTPTTLADASLELGSDLSPKSPRPAGSP